MKFGDMHEFVKDNPMTTPLDPGVTRSLALGVPHPQYGVMRASMFVTPATSLTRLASIVHRITSHEFAVSHLPHVYVGRREFKDVVHGRERTVVGIVAFCGVSGEVEYAPLGLVAWEGMWLPYFEDANDWVMTGWNTIGWVATIFKPFGWGGAFAEADDDDADADPPQASSACSRNGVVAETAASGDMAVHRRVEDVTESWCA